MRILLFGKNRRKKAAKGRVTKGLSVETYPIRDLPAMIATLQSGTLVYLELAGLGPAERQEILALHPGKSRTSFRGGGSGGHGG